MTGLKRRQFLFAGAIGALGAGAPGAAQMLARGFTHGVASGDPAQTSVRLWTRYVPARGDAAMIAIEVAEDSGFGRVVARSEAIASPDNDWCVNQPVGGLSPGRWYFYRFRGADHSLSAVGRTRTMPDRGTAPFRIAAFSCANLPFGWFNAYAHAAARNDIDLVVHLGDYIYEYPRGDYPSVEQALAGRIIEPATEIVRLADYRARYASYRADPDLQRLHQLWPSISIWDDHETANDSWKGGAQNHQPETEGDWRERVRVALKAYREWLPMGDAPFATTRIGDLLTLTRLETRVHGRDQQLALPETGLEAFRDGVWSARARTMLGADQEVWLGEQLRSSAKDGARWQVVAHQVLAGKLTTPREATVAWLGPNPGKLSASRFGAALRASTAGLPSSLDTWNGYPAARARLMRQAQDAGANLVMIAGDTHNAWAFDLADDGGAAGVEFGAPGVTSPGLESYLRGVAAPDLAAALVRQNPELKWCDTARRGYMTLTFTADDMRCDWHLLDTVRERSTTGRAASATVARGRNRLSLG